MGFRSRVRDACALLCATSGFACGRVGFGLVAALSLSEPDPYVFASTPAGSFSDHVFVVSNAGSGVATAVAASGLALPFSVQADTCGASLAASTSCDLRVRFAPSTTGTFNGTLRLDYYDGAAARQVSRTVQGAEGNVVSALLVVSGPNPYFFGHERIGATVRYDFVIMNQGQSTATAMTFSGLVAPFSYLSGTCGPALLSGNTCTAAIEFSPAALGESPQELVLDYNDGTGPAQTRLAVVGDGTAASLIYRSVGPKNTAALATGAANPVVVTSGQASFTSALPLNIGVGDALQYDANNDGAVDALAFVHGRGSATEYVVRDASGGVPAATSAPDSNWAIFRAYTSLAAAENGGGENAGVDLGLRDFDAWSLGVDLVAAGRTWSIACYGDAVDDVAVVVDGWTTGPDNFLRIYTPVAVREVGASQRHLGRWGAGAYQLVTTGASDAIGIDDRYVRIDGLLISAANSTNLGAVVGIGRVGLVQAPAEVLISNNVIRGAFSGSATLHAGIGSDTVEPGALIKVWNNIVYGIGAALLRPCIIVEDTTMFAFNNTAYDCPSGLMTGSNSVMVAKNNIAPTYGGSGVFAPESNYNIAASGSSTGGANDQTNVTMRFVDAAGQDFHLSAAFVEAIGTGLDLSTDSDLRSLDDVDGELRASPWDIGADQR